MALQSGILFLVFSGGTGHFEERKAELLNGPGSRAEGKDATSCLHQDHGFQMSSVWWMLVVSFAPEACS